MWEFELIANKSISPYLQKLVFRMQNVIKSTNSVSALLADEMCIYFSIGCQEQNQSFVKTALRIALCELYCVDLKKEYLQNNLNISKCSIEKQEVLLPLCVHFDREMERSVVLNLLDLDSKKLCVNSFYNFKLHSLERKWQEFCELINQNVSLISKPKNYDDLIAFLLCSIDSRCENAIINPREKLIVYRNSLNEDIAEHLDPTQSLVLNKLIELNPHFITIKASKGYTKLIECVRRVFGSRVLT